MASISDHYSITSDRETKVRRFLTSDTWIVPGGVKVVELFLVGPGGYGGDMQHAYSDVGAGGGGGGGQVVHKFVNVSGVITVIIGSSGRETSGTSSFGTHIAEGGGRGGYSLEVGGAGLRGNNGANGGGNGVLEYFSYETVIGGGGGGAGGSSGNSSLSDMGNYSRGGIGLLGYDGGAYVTNENISICRDGGIGINGYGGGGGGGAVAEGSPTADNAGHGVDGGGDGGYTYNDDDHSYGSNGAPNSGGGGGGGSYIGNFQNPGYGGEGGSGICIITWIE